MPLGFGYLYKFVMFYFFFFQKAENNRLKKASWSKFCNIIFMFLLKIGSVGPVNHKLTWSRQMEEPVIVLRFPLFHDEKC